VNRIESQGNIGSISPNRVTSPDRSNSPSRSPRPTSPGILTEPTSPKSRATSWFSKTQGVIKFQHTRRPFATQVMLLLRAEMHAGLDSMVHWYKFIEVWELQFSLLEFTINFFENIF
jgi:hypothetical protein